MGNEPFKTCFFGVPIGNTHELITVTQGYTNNCTNLANANISEAACCIINGLNITLPGDPQELDLLGSVAVGNGSENWTETCFMVGAYEQGIDVYRSHNLIGWIKVSTSTSGFGCEDKGSYCGTNNKNQGMGALGAGIVGKQGTPTVWKNGTAKALPLGIFLICGDRAWQGIPAKAFGGLCYLGRLTLYATSLHDIMNQA